MDGYTLTRRWFDWCFKNQGYYSPTHAALYQWYMEWCNRSKWPDQFEMDSKYAMVAIGIRAYNTYKDTIADLHDWGFVRILQVGSNQHSPWLIALSNFDEPLNEPRDKANLSASSKFDNPLNKARDKAHDKALDEPRDTLTIKDKQEPETIKPETKVISLSSFESAQTGTSSFSASVPIAQSQGLPLVPEIPPNPQVPAAPLSPDKPKAVPIPIEERIEAFKETVRAFYRENKDKYPPEMYVAFIAYWIEKSENAKKFRREKESTWDLSARLERWNTNNLNRSFSAPNGRSNQTNQKSSRVEPVQGQSFGSWSGNKFSSPNSNGRDKAV